jgi:ABC-type multidrug transport system fused ATPase/permease subunit
MDNGLASWFRIWRPRYRGVLVQLALAAALAAALLYLQQSLLDLLTLSLASNPAAAPAGSGESANKALTVLSDYAASLGLDPASLPLLVLGLFILVAVIASGMDYWKVRVTGRLRVRSEDDLESEILAHLLRKDDAFFARHSPSETVNRLAVDVYRTTENRPNVMLAVAAATLIVSSLGYFLQKDWRLAGVAFGGCVAGALWTFHMTKRVKDMDASYLRYDDRVKSHFEDCLRASPEIQVGDLHRKVRRHFEEVQEDRTRTYIRYVGLNAALSVGSAAWYLLALIVMIFVALHLRHSGGRNSSLALVPVVIWALPRLFNSASSLVFLNLQFQLARTSMKRLLEYEAIASPAPGSAPPAGRTETRPAEEITRVEPIRAERLTYRYASADGAQQAGLSEVSATFVPGQWTALVGAAGSGKSTLLRLLLRRARPQEGDLFYGDQSLQSLSAPQLAGLFSIMPQSVALLDATIRENLLFGRTSPDLTEADLEVVESAGLAKVCRLKALDMLPEKERDCAELCGRIAEIRNRLRERLRKECGTVILPFEDGRADAKHWVLEHLLNGRCDRERAAQLLLRKARAGSLKTLPGTPLGAELVRAGRAVLQQNRHLLQIPNFHVYCQLAPLAIDESLWQLRSSHVALADGAALSPAEALAFCAIALTSCPSEFADGEGSRDWGDPDFKNPCAEEIALLKNALGDACKGFAVGAIHPHLTWRENLIFGVVQSQNARTRRLADQAILNFVEQDGLRQAFTRLGLEFGIGRLGANLSGGQGQLVALCRALLRRTPVLVLDEPTSSLDPAGCSAVQALLRTWKTNRIVITVSHDVELMRQADVVQVMDGGRLVAQGSFTELEAGSDVFRKILRQA